MDNNNNNNNKLTFQQMIDIDLGNLPLTCNCGCTDTEEKNIVWLDMMGSVKCEYDVHCSKCGKYLGSFEYGHWTY